MSTTELGQKLNREDFSYVYGMTGYMIKFRGHNLGGAGVRTKPKHWMHQRANLRAFQEDAEREIRAILSSRGQYRFLEHIREILEKE